MIYYGHISFSSILLFSFFRVLCSIVILGKACDLIDYHQHNRLPSKNLIEKTMSKKAQKTVCFTDPKSDKNISSTPSKSPLKISLPKINGFKQEAEILDNTLDITEIPCSPVTPRTIEATNKDLRRSAIMLEDKIQTMFRKREPDDLVPEANNDSMKGNHEENRESNMILKAIGTTNRVFYIRLSKWYEF